MMFWSPSMIFNFYHMFYMLGHPCKRKKEKTKTFIVSFLSCVVVLETWEFLQNRMANEKQLKWEGEASAELNGPEAEQVWPLLEDFFGLHKWFPTLTTCLGVEGISGQPGCVRYCAGFKTPVDHKREQDQDQEKVNWTKQKLLSIDPAQLIFSYSIIDGNVGFNSYISTVQVVPKEGGCSIVWKYEVEPVEGWKMEDLDMFIGTGLQVMASRMEASLQLQVGPLEP